jgi:hypothetical protein
MPAGGYAAIAMDANEIFATAVVIIVALMAIGAAAALVIALSYA